jgi:glycosyltransferase involved in cell wall biosynthesis
MTAPLVSVIIPCYRQGRLLPEALASVFNQTHPRVEVIVVNDGSDDDTEAVATSYGDRVRYLYQPNSGPAAARNTGLAVARGDWAQFLDADDLLHPEKVRLQLTADEDRSDVVYSGYECFQDGRPEERWTYSAVELGRADAFSSFALDWDRGLSIPLHGMLFRRALFERLGVFDTVLPRHEDWDWHLRCAAAGARFRYVPGRTALYRMTATNRSSPAHRAAMLLGKYALLEKFLFGRGLSPSQRKAVLERYVTERAAEVFARADKRDFIGAVTLLAQRTVGGGPFSSRSLYPYSVFLAKVGRQGGGKVVRRVARALGAL